MILIEEFVCDGHVDNIGRRICLQWTIPVQRNITVMLQSGDIQQLNTL